MEWLEQLRSDGDRALRLDTDLEYFAADAQDQTQGRRTRKFVQRGPAGTASAPGGAEGENRQGPRDRPEGPADGHLDLRRGEILPPDHRQPRSAYASSATNGPPAETCSAWSNVSTTTCRKIKSPPSGRPTRKSFFDNLDSGYLGRSRRLRVLVDLRPPNSCMPPRRPSGLTCRSSSPR